MEDSKSIEGGGLCGGRLRVTHLLFKLGFGGTEVGVVQLVNALDRDLVETSICSFVGADSLKGRLRPDVRLFEFSRRNGNDPVLVAKLFGLFRRERPHVVHTHGWGTLCEGVVAARCARVPVLVHGEHGTMEMRATNLRVQRLAWKSVSQVLSVSSRLADRLAREVGFPRDRIRTIRNGVDGRRFEAISRAAAREAIGVKPTDLLIGTVGRLVAVKDHETLLEALAVLARKVNRLQAVVVGDGPLLDLLARRRSELGLDGVVRFLRHRDDVEKVLGALDIFVLSSVSEGLPNTILEAMAAGLPVVATDVGGVGEMVVHGETGLLVPPGSPGRLSDALLGLVANPAARTRLGATARRRVQTQFGLHRMVSEYQSLYLNLVHASGLGHASARRDMLEKRAPTGA